MEQLFKINSSLIHTSIHAPTLVSYCGTPLVYYLGMEENRNAVQAYLRSTIQVVRRPGKVAPSPSGVAAPQAGVFTVSDLAMGNIKTAHTIPGQVEEQNKNDEFTL